MSFPSHWPDHCPPPDSKNANHTVYHIVHENPPGAKDLLTADEQGKHNNKDQCMRVGISVFTKYEDANFRLSQMPFLGKHIAYGELRPKHGNIKQTGKPSHHTWWPSDGIRRDTIFRVEE